MLRISTQRSAASLWELRTQAAASRPGTIVPMDLDFAQVPLRPAKARCAERAARYCIKHSRPR